MIRKYILPLLTLVFVFSSCDSFLDEAPDSRLRLNNSEKIFELLTNAYPSGSTAFLEWMSDNVGPDPKNRQQPQITQAYKWETVTIEGQDSPTYFWSSCYNAISHANQALLALEELEDVSADEKAAIKGEAFACRAYAHFMLVNVFAKAYDAKTASSDLGIVLMEEPETTLLATYKRSTVQQTYDFIEKDLLNAIDLVSDNFYKNSGKYHFTKKAVYALASRYYLFKGDYANCVKYSTLLLGEDYNETYQRNYNTIYKGSSAEIMARKFTSPDLESNLLLVRKDVLYGYTPYYGYRFNEDIVRALVLDRTDLRFAVAYSYGGTTQFLPKYERSLMRKLSLTSSSGYPYTVSMAFRSEEVILNRLEAWLMLGDEESMKKYKSHFNSYLLKSYSNKYGYDVIRNTYKGNNSDLSDAELEVKMLIDERRREFMEEELRWFDLKRHNLKVTHVDLDGVTHVLTKDDPRKVLQIPVPAIEFGDLTPNEIDVASQPEAFRVRR